MPNVVATTVALSPGPPVTLTPNVPVNDFRVKAHVTPANLSTGAVVSIGTGGANPGIVTLDLSGPNPGVGLVVNGTPVGLAPVYTPTAPTSDVWITATKQGSSLQAAIWSADPDQGGAELVALDFQLTAAQAASYSGATAAFSASVTGGNASFPLDIDSLDRAPQTVTDTTSLTAGRPQDTDGESAPAVSVDGGQAPREAGQDETPGDSSTTSGPGTF